MIANCSSDENGKYSGGKAGDQTGREYVIRTWYNRPWSHIIRCTNEKARKLLKQLAEEAANNDKIGYDQGTSGNSNDRYTFWSEVQKVGYRPANIKNACETDCSNSTAVLVKCVGYILGIKELQKVSIYSYSGNIRTALVNTGYFKVIIDPNYLSSDDYLLEGDILLYEGHHVTINLTDGAKVKKNTWYETQVSTGAFGLTVSASSLNVRSGPGDYPVIDTISNGTRVFPFGKAYIGNQMWFHISSGWVSGKYLSNGWVKEEPAKANDVNTWWYITSDNNYYTLKDGECLIDDKKYLFKISGYLYVPADFDISNYNIIGE